VPKDQRGYEGLSGGGSSEEAGFGGRSSHGTALGGRGAVVGAKPVAKCEAPLWFRIEGSGFRV